MHHTPSSLQNNASEELQIGHGNYFSFALPPGWRVAEDGQFALSLVAPDNKSHYGNGGQCRVDAGVSSGKLCV